MDYSLANFAEIVEKADNLETLTRSILGLVGAVTQLESTFFTTIDWEKGIQHIVFSNNIGSFQIPEDLSTPWEYTLCKRVLEEQRFYANDVASRWQEVTAARALGIQTYISYPVKIGDGHTYGTLCAASTQASQVSDAALTIIKLCATIIGQYLGQAYLLQRMERENFELKIQVSTDPLTGLANRRALLEGTEKLLAQSKVTGRCLQVAFIDLDGFKKINDQYGHAIGDRFLIQIAERLRKVATEDELVGRYGGDEFVFVSHKQSRPALQKTLEAACQGHFQLAEHSLDYAGPSIGLITADPTEEDVTSLLKRADAAMYQVKQQRRTSR
jgi:diguanylate cyclase